MSSGSFNTRSDQRRDTTGTGTGEIIWTPSVERLDTAEITRYQAWLSEERGLAFSTYADLQAWSAKEISAFWGSIRDYFDLQSLAGDGPVLAVDTMPGAVWFPGRSINYAERLLGGNPDHLAVVAAGEDGRCERLTYRELRGCVAGVSAGLRSLGVEPGDRVAAVLPTGLHALIAMLACASLGAVWSSCSPDYGPRSIADRFAQIEPRVLIAADGYAYNGRSFDIRGRIGELVTLLPSLQATVLVGHLDTTAVMAGTIPWSDIETSSAELTFERVAFDHPLWILYSSGTTGLPKAILHGHGGIVLEHVKAIRLHLNMGVTDRLLWFTTTAWMMWNYLVAGLLSGGTVVLYDGSPSFPSRDALWALAARERVTILGTGAPFLAASQRQAMRPRDVHDLTAVHTVGSTGSPLAPETFVWAAESIASDVLVASMSGTDICSGFVASCPVLPVHAGEIQCRMLGCAVEAFDADGRPQVGTAGELVVTRPMPSMPLRFWNDPGDARYHEAYFSTYPGVWRHGDVITFLPDGGAIISGRSDATLNRGGVRIGTAEFYRVLDSQPEIADSLILEVDSKLFLFLAPAPGRSVDDQKITRLLRESLTPRHVPDHVVTVPVVPRTATGKKPEVPIRRLLSGTPLTDALDPGSLADPTSIEPFMALARDLADQRRAESAEPRGT